jgi:hypothetical protein
MVPMHQPALLGTLLALQRTNVLPFLPSLVGLYVQPVCAVTLSDYILEVLARPSATTEYIVNELCENGILSMISALICEMGPGVPASVVLVLAQIILTFSHPTELLLAQATEILNSIFSIDSAAETALIIAAHLARLSKDFLPSLTECGALNLAGRALQSDIAQIRSKGLDFVGNLCRHTALPDEYLQGFVPSLVANLGDPDPVCRKLAAFALGNVLFWSPEASAMVVDGIGAVTTLLKSDDPKTVENAAGVLGNLVRKSGQYVPRILREGAVDALVNTLGERPELEGKPLFPLSAFCQYDEARTYLKTINSQVIISRYSASGDDRVKRYCKNIISSLV